ncbi:anti-sigma-K factor RskA [Marmoricola sp. URHA0025 HA25]
MSSSGNAHEIHALSGAYAVHALDDEEKALFEAHLAACATCQAEVAGLREATASLAESVSTDPPAALRDQVLAGIKNVRPLPPELEQPAPARVRTLPVRRRLTALAAAAALVGVAGVGTVVWHQTTSSDQGSLTAADRVLRATDAKRVDLTLEGGGRASVVRSVSQGKAVLIARDMPRAPADRVYELWLQTPGGVMVPAGLMDGGSATVVLRGDASSATAAGITVEPKGGSPAPTTAPVALFDFERAT